jgi:hypothetical protein
MMIVLLKNLILLVMKSKIKDLKIQVKEINFAIFVVFDKDYTEDCEAYTVYSEDEGKRPTIVFNSSESIPIRTIVHELCHAILADMEDIGHSSLGDPLGETFPYLMGSCTEKILKYCKKHKIKTSI